MQDVQRTHQFQTLDALRGIAALLVVMLHGGMPFFPFFPHLAYLAVDLFFVLSGFVLSYAYQGRLDHGLTTTRFLAHRLIRLTPLYLFGTLLGFVANVLRSSYGPFTLSWPLYIRQLALGLVFLPSPGRHGLYPLNGAAWTLLLELLVNLVHALFWRRLRTSVLALTCGGSLILLIAADLHFHSQNEGALGQHSFLLAGVPRVLFSYTAGMLLFRLWSRARPPVPRVPAWLILTAAAAALSLPRHNSVPAALWCTGLLFPALVYLGACTEPGPLLKRIFGALGAASYAIYVVHDPLLLLAFRFVPPGTYASGWAGIVFLLVLIPFALLLDRFWDAPLRQRLRRRFLG